MKPKRTHYRPAPCGIATPYNRPASARMSDDLEQVDCPNCRHQEKHRREASDAEALMQTIARQTAQDAPPVADLPFALTAETRSTRSRQTALDFDHEPETVNPRRQE